MTNFSRELESVKPDRPSITENTISEIKNLVDEVQSSQDTAEKCQQLYIQTQGQKKDRKLWNRVKETCEIQ